MKNRFISNTKDFIIKYSNKDFIIPAAFISLVISMIYNPLNHVNVASFDRSLGHAIMNGVDINKRVSNFQFYLFILIPILFLIIYMSICFLCHQKDEENKESIKFLNIISIISFIQLIISYINKFTVMNNTAFSIGITLPSCILVIILFYLMISRIFKNIFNFKLLKWCIFSTFPVFFIATIFVYSIKIQYNSIYSAIIYSAILLVFYLSVSLFQYKTNNKIHLETLQIAYIPMMIAPSIVSIFLETTNVLNQYNVFIHSKLRFTLVIYLVSLTLIPLIYFFLKRKKMSNSKFKMENFYYPLLIIAFSLILAQPDLQKTVNLDVFEAGNFGVSISQLFNYGKLPIVESFDAHMLSMQIWGIIYGFINGDYYGATCLFYLSYELVFFFILSYYILKNFFDEDKALMLTLFYPLLFDGAGEVLGSINVSPYYLGFLVILAFISAYKKPKFKTYILFWISIAIGCLYRLDTGFSFAIGATLTWPLVYLLDKNSVKLKQLTISCVLVVASCLGIFSSLCILRDISPKDRIYEILKLSMSNINWSYSTIGDPNKISFSLCYIFLPLTLVTLFVVILTKKLKDKTFLSNTQFIILSNIALAYIANFSRGLVRHSLVEQFTTILALCGPLFIAMALSVLSKKHKLITFVGSYFSIILLLFVIINPTNKAPQSLTNLSINKYLDFQPYKISANTKVQRATINKDIESQIKPAVDTINSLLAPTETFLDFTNTGLIYSLTAKESPVYVNQSPALLSGERMQQMFIDEVEKNCANVSYVLMPTKFFSVSSSLDGILNSYRYYLVSEYISKNYRPLIQTGDYAIWCKKNLYTEKKLMADKMIANNSNSESPIIKDNTSPTVLEMIDYSYGDYNALHNYNLNEIPYTWAKYDKKSISSKEILLDIQNNFSLNKEALKIFNFDISKIDKESGNYICITASSPVDSSLTLELGEKTSSEFNSLSTYSFNLKAGENISYLIRVSSDFVWYSDTINSIKLNSQTNLDDVNVSILKGDTLD